MATGDTMLMTWKVWSTATTADTSSTNSDAWNEWSATTNAATSSADTWGTWNNSVGMRPSAIWTPREPPEERVEREKRQKEVDQAAEELLKSCLSPTQKEEFEKGQRFHLVSEKGERYEIDCKRREHNVYRLNADGKRAEELCGRLDYPIPRADSALAQKLMLETDEERFRKVANIRRIA